MRTSSILVLLAGCPAATTSPPPMALAGRYTKVMEDSGQIAWLEISRGADGTPSVGQWALDPGVETGAIASRLTVLRVDGDDILVPFACSRGPNDDLVEGAARITPTAAGLELRLVSPPDVGASWDCNGDFDTLFGQYSRR